VSVAEKLLQIRKNLKPIPKNISVKGTGWSYKAVSDDDVMDAVKPALDEANLLVTIRDLVITVNGKITTLVGVVRFTDAGAKDFEDVWSVGQGADSQDKGAGKAMTYLLKYAFLKTFLAKTGDDPDQIGSHVMDEADNKAAAKAKELITRANTLYMNEKMDKERNVGINQRIDDNRTDLHYLTTKVEPFLADLEK